MERKNALLLGIGVVVFLITLTVMLIVTSARDTTPSTFSPQESCNNYLSSDSGTYNLLFFGSREETEVYTGYLFADQPYARNKEMFNIYYIDNAYVKETCKIYKGVATLCYSDELLKAAAACPHNTIVVLVDEPSEIRSSAYKNVISLNKNHPAQEVLRHELGHIFGLGEEYVPASLSLGQRNCQHSCNEFLTNEAGCFEGCSESSLFRSVEDGVMRTLAYSHYGSFDEKLIEDRLNTFSSQGTTLITGNALNSQESCADNSFHLLEIDTSSEVWTISSQQRVNGCASELANEPYRFESVDEAGTPLIEGTFDDATLFTDAPTQDQTITGEIYQETKFWIEVPEVSEEKTLNFYDENNLLRAQTTLFPGGVSLCKL